MIKDRVWFFVSYQGSREKNGISFSNSIGTVFVPENLSNDRSTATLDAFAAILEPGLPVHVLSARVFDPTAQFLLQATLPNGSYVIPSAPHRDHRSSMRRPLWLPSSKFREDQINTNLDFQISPANRLSGKFFGANNPSFKACSICSDWQTLFLFRVLAALQILIKECFRLTTRTLSLRTW